MSFLGGGLDFCMDSPKSTSVFGGQGDGSYPSRPVAEHCHQKCRMPTPMRCRQHVLPAPLYLVKKLRLKGLIDEGPLLIHII